MSERTPEEIRADCLYTSRELKSRARAGEATWREWKRSGLPTFRAGKTVFVYGGDFIEFLRAKASRARSEE